MNKPPVDCTRATKADLQNVILIHKNTFNKKFTTLLGSNFLFQYYSLFLNEGFYFFIAKNGDKTLGFIAGVSDFRLLAKNLRKNIYLFVSPILRSLSVKTFPYILIRTYGFLFKNRANDIPFDLTQYNEITSFAVDNSSQGLGIGKSLLEKYISEINDNVIPGVFLTTDANDNESTIGFYKKNGFTIKHTYSQSKEREMHVMIREFC